MAQKRGKLIELKDVGGRINRDGPTQWASDDNLRQGKPVWSGRRPPRRSPSELIPVWNDPMVGAAIRSHVTPASYQHPPEIDDELIEALSTCQPIAARFDLIVGQDKGVYPFFPLERFRGQPGGTVPISQGSILAYAGIVRTTERKWVDGGGGFGGFPFAEQRPVDVQVFKHTFITPLGRCIIHDFGLVRPA